jgi:hypothetical protein
MADPTTYQFRSNAFVKMRRYTLTDDAMTWEEEGKPLDGVFYDDISEIRLAYAPTRWETNRYRAQIIFRQGGMAELFNVDYRGFADFAQLNDEYVAFLRELHRRLADKSVPVVLRKGNSAAAYVGNIALAALIAVGLAAIFVVLVTIGLAWLAIVKLMVILFFIPTLIRYMQRAKPGTYDPRAIPDDMLPALDTARPSNAPA